VGQLAYRILLSWGQQLMLVHKRAPKYFCAQDKFTKYNGTSLCIHLLRQGFFFFWGYLLRQFYASHLYNVWQEMQNIVTSCQAQNGVLQQKEQYTVLPLPSLFSFFFLIALSSPWTSSRTVVKQHFTLPSHSWYLDPNTLLLHLGIDTIEYLCSS